MKVNSISILSTRRLDEAIIEKAARNKIIIETKDFIETKKLVTDEVGRQIIQLAKEKVTVVFTSFNSVKAVAETLSTASAKPAWNVFSMAGTTFNLISKLLPFCNIVSTSSNAEDLAMEIAGHNVKDVVFFCGNQRRHELPDLLQKEKIRLKELIVYETIETPVKLDKVYDGILFFSPSAVSSFFSDNNVSNKTVFFAIGKTTANAIKKFGINNIVVSDFPAKEQLAEKAIQYFIDNS